MSLSLPLFLTHEKTTVFLSRAPKYSGGRVVCYSNSVATKQIILLSGNIETNPGHPEITEIQARTGRESLKRDENTARGTGIPLESGCVRLSIRVC